VGRTRAFPGAETSNLPTLPRAVRAASGTPLRGSDSATDSIDACNSSERGEMPELRVEEQIRVVCF